MTSDFEKTFDKKLNNLEHSILETTPTKKLVIKIGIIAFINAVALAIIKPIYIMDININENNNKKVIKLNVPYYILAILILTIFVYFGSNMYNKYK